MIELINGYYIKSTPYEYMLVHDTRRVDIKTGEPIFETISHHGTLAEAIRGALMDSQRRRLSDGDMTLKEAMIANAKLHEEFIALLKEVTKLSELK